jgi:hypothetical protein
VVLAEDVLIPTVLAIDLRDVGRCGASGMVVCIGGFAGTVNWAFSVLRAL